MWSTSRSKTRILWNVWKKVEMITRKMFNINGSTVKYSIIDNLLDFDRRINRYGHGLWYYTPREYKEESMDLKYGI